MVVPESESEEQVGDLSAWVKTQRGIWGTGGGGIWKWGEGGGEAREVRDVVRWCWGDARGRFIGSERDWVREAEEMLSIAERMRFGWRWRSDRRGERSSHDRTVRRERSCRRPGGRLGDDDDDDEGLREEGEGSGVNAQRGGEGALGGGDSGRKHDMAMICTRRVIIYQRRIGSSIFISDPLPDPRPIARCHTLSDSTRGMPGESYLYIHQGVFSIARVLLRLSKCPLSVLVFSVHAMFVYRPNHDSLSLNR